jgi:hypothetical protein
MSAGVVMPSACFETAPSATAGGSMARNIAEILAGLMVLGLLACTSPEKLRTEDEAMCAGYGFPRGTIDFANCMQRESLARRYGPWLGPPSFAYGWSDGHFSPRAPVRDGGQ